MPHLEDALLKRKAFINPLDSWYVIDEQEQFMRPQQYNRLFSEFVERNRLVDAHGKKIDEQLLITSNCSFLLLD